MLYGYFDGGARGNPGPAGAGWVLGLDANTDTGEVRSPVTAGCEYVGDHNTNNVAEFTGLIRLLEAAIERRGVIDRLTIHGDSKLAFELIDGTKQAHSPKIIPLLKRTWELIAELALGPNLVLEHVRRERNKMADLLSNVAMDHALTQSGLAVLDVKPKTAEQRKRDRDSRKRKRDAAERPAKRQAAEAAEAASAEAASAGLATRVRIRRRRDGTVVQGCDRYVGRACDLGGWDLARDDFCNPIPVKQCGGSNAEAVRRYRGHLASRPDLLRRIVAGELDGLRLGCFCDFPKPCHADVLCELANDHAKAEALLAPK